MVLSTLFHKGDLGTLPVDRIEAVNTGKLAAIRDADNETALALELQADRICALAKNSFTPSS